MVSRRRTAKRYRRRIEPGHVATARRHAAARVVFAVVLVASFGALFAHAFRESIAATIEWFAGSGDPTEAAASLPWWATAALVTGSLLFAAELAHRVRCRRGERVGLEAIAAAARGEGTGPDVKCTLARASATWVAMSGLASLGREAPILETSGSVGAYVGRKLKLSTAHLAIVGVAAGFASAYHAPAAAVFYVREHVVPGATRRASVYAVVGSLLGFAVTVLLFRTRPPFPRAHNPFSASSLLLAAIGLVPAYVAARAFFALRHRVQHPGVWLRRHRRAFGTTLAVAAGALVAAMPATSGNGMDLIRRGAVESTLAVGALLLLGKLVATLACLGSGAPGGVFSPSLAIAAGAGLMMYHVPFIAHLVPNTDARWDAMLVLMSVAVVIGTRSPLTAILVVPELAGDWRLLPVTVAAVGITLLLDDVASHLITRTTAIINSRGSGDLDA